MTTDRCAYPGCGLPLSDSKHGQTHTFVAPSPEATKEPKDQQSEKCPACGCGDYWLVAQDQYGKMPAVAKCKNCGRHYDLKLSKPSPEKDGEMCPTCNGEPLEYKSMAQETCPTCHGSGKEPQDKCPECNVGDGRHLFVCSLRSEPQSSQEGELELPKADPEYNIALTDAFLKHMEGRHYGEEERADAFEHFKAGFDVNYAAKSKEREK